MADTFPIYYTLQLVERFLCMIMACIHDHFDLQNVRSAVNCDRDLLQINASKCGLTWLTRLYKVAIFARSPAGGSVVIFNPFLRIEIGNLGLGADDSQSLKSA